MGGGESCVKYIINNNRHKIGDNKKCHRTENTDIGWEARCEKNAAKCTRCRDARHKKITISGDRWMKSLKMTKTRKNKREDEKERLYRSEGGGRKSPTKNSAFRVIRAKGLDTAGRREHPVIKKNNEHRKR